MNDNYIGFKVTNMDFDAHLTLLYTGPLSDEQKAVALKVISESSWPGFAFVERSEFAMFGPDLDIPVVKVQVPEVMRELRATLLLAGLPDPSQFREWNPHITLKPSNPKPDIRIPCYLRIEKLSVY